MIMATVPRLSNSSDVAMMDIVAIDHAVADWLRIDRNPETRLEIQQLAAERSYDELRSRFSSRISFGTAGLRARMQAGPSSMNEVTVIQTSQGLAQYAAQFSGSREKGIVIGHDHRWRSERFAELTAAVFVRKGFKVFLLDGLVHTPMVPFVAKRKGAALGVMITASHNPAQDNGYKVYWTNHVQIIAPHDTAIARVILENLEVAEDAFQVSPSSYKDTELMKAQYTAMAARLCLKKDQNERCPLRFTYTPMHGVGLPFAQAVLSSWGFSKDCFIIVPTQANPDPSFPTVKFPNPEEKGALNLAMAYADAAGSSIVLANDPDADRFCAAEKSGGEWKVFTGDQLGTLLGYWVFSQYKAAGLPIPKLAMCASTVSSKMLEAIAKKEGFTFRETLTGFKYMGNEALKLESENFACLFAYEEAIGYMLGNEMRDKDGVTAMATFCEMATSLAISANLSVHDQLIALYEMYGYFATSNSYVISQDKAKTDQMFFQLRYGNNASPSSLKTLEDLQLPKTLAGFSITYIRDLTIGYDSSRGPSFVPELPVDPHSQMITFRLGSSDAGDGVEVTGTVRTSGTEPKIKYYIEANGKNCSIVEAKLLQVTKALVREWLQAEAFEFEEAAN